MGPYDLGCIPATDQLLLSLLFRLRRHLSPVGLLISTYLPGELRAASGIEPIAIRLEEELPSFDLSFGGCRIVVVVVCWSVLVLESRWTL